jgi:hypothetical protein
LTLLDLIMQAGLTPELIDTLSIISDHLPTQRNLVQLRLLEETLKVLGGSSRPLLQEPDYLYSWAKYGERIYVPANADNSSTATGGSSGGAGGVGYGMGMGMGHQSQRTPSPGMLTNGSMTNLAGAGAGMGGGGGGGGGGVSSAGGGMGNISAGGVGGAGGSMNEPYNRTSVGLSIRSSAVSPSPSMIGGSGVKTVTPKASSGGFMVSVLCCYCLFLFLSLLCIACLFNPDFSTFAIFFVGCVLCTNRG